MRNPVTYPFYFSLRQQGCTATSLLPEHNCFFVVDELVQCALNNGLHTMEHHVQLPCVLQ